MDEKKNDENQKNQNYFTESPRYGSVYRIDVFIYSQPHIHIRKIAAEAAASSTQQRKFTKIKQIKQEKG